MISGQHDLGDDGGRRDYEHKLTSLCRRKQQRVRHHWQQSEQDFGQISAIGVGDVTSDLADEMLIGTEDGQILAVNVASKRIIWQHSLGKAVKLIQTGPKDPAGYDTTLLCTGDEQIYVLDENGKIVAVQGQAFPGEHIISIFISRQGKPPFDSIREILLGSQEKNIYVYDADLQKRHTTINVPDGVNVLCSHDLIAKDSTEILAGTLGGLVYAYQRRGQSAEKLWCYQTGACVRALAVKDLDEDGSVEVIVGSDDGNVYVLNAQGQLKWRYYTLAPVLAVCVLDIDHDGKIEILLGGADGTLYALNSEGDLCWTVQMHKPIRGICARDMEAVVEIALNVGGKFGLLQVIGLQEWQDIQKELQHCIEQINSTGDVQAIILEMASSADGAVRISALEALIDYSKDDVERMHQLEQLLQAIADSPQQEVRLSLVNLLHRFVALNAPLCFEYIKLFTSDPDLWVCRAAIRQLDKLVVLYPTDVFPILRERIASENEWICLECGRVLAHCFDVHRDNLIDEVSDLLRVSVKPLVMQQIATSSVQSSVRSFFTILTDLLSYHNSERYKDLLVLLLAHTLADLETTQSVHVFAQNAGTLYSSPMTRIRLNRLFTLLNNLLTSKKAGISYDYAAGLHTAITTLEDLEKELQMDNNVRPSRVSEDLQETLVAANMLLALLIHRGRDIVKAELHGLEGQTRIIPEFRIRLLRHGEQCEVSVRVSNAGNREAWNVRMVLELNDDRFEIVGSNEQYLGTVSPQKPLLARFAIVVKPQVDTLRLSFMIIYDDMHGPNHKIFFSEQVMSQKPFKEIPNPYSSSEPVRNKGMFFDRTESLQFLRGVLRGADTKIVFLYGQRRSGKTSLIYQLVNELHDLGGYVPIFLDLQGLPMECTGPNILASLTTDILDTLKERGLTVSISYDMQADPLYAFESFLKQLVVELPGRKLVLFIDEFDRLEEFVKDTTLSLPFVKALIALMKRIDGISFLVTGGPQLRRTAEITWSCLDETVKVHHLLQLEAKGASELITYPVKGQLSYDERVIRFIQNLTNNQPYLIQMFCERIVSLCNKRHVDYVDGMLVASAVDSILDRGASHFKWMWDHLGPQEQQVLSALAWVQKAEEESVALRDIILLYQSNGIMHRRELLRQTLERLEEQNHIVTVNDSTASYRWKIAADLMREWLQRTKPFTKSLRERPTRQLENE